MPTLDMRPVDPADGAAMRELVEVLNVVNAADSPWLWPEDVHTLSNQLRYGHDLEPARHFLFCQESQVVAEGWIAVSDWDNLDLAWMRFSVLPRVRRQGLGSQALELVLEEVRRLGRNKVGTHAWDSAAARGFATRHGFPLLGTEVNRRQYVGEIGEGLVDSVHAEALRHATGYELVHVAGPMPQELMDSYVVALSALNDAPTDDLDIEDEVFNVQRSRDYEEASRLRGQRIYRLLAVHTASGEVAGVTGVGVVGEHPERAFQHDTEVVPAHRGRRLGLLLKSGMLRWLADAEPQVATIDTWNAESNSFMIGVNDRLGYRVLGRALQFQRAI